jgi:dTDP-4-dehydrorhamnose reductase
MEIVLITGATGQLGSVLVASLSKNYQVIPTSSVDFNIADFNETKEYILKKRPDVIIHSAAYTDVDGCETNHDKAFRVNGLGTRNVAVATRQVKAKLFYISTDYVFDGSKIEPYYEYDQPNPLNIYGKSKLFGEESVKEQLNQFFIIRAAWLYGKKRKNFVKTMLELATKNEKLKVVNDQRGTPTYTADLSNQIKELIHTDLYGTYHCTSQGSCTWYEFALEIFRLNGLDVKIEPVTSEEFSRAAKRPKNSVLENYMLKLQGIDLMPHWKESLKRFMGEFNLQSELVAQMEEAL